MKRIKTYLVYGIIAILLIAAAGSYIVRNMPKEASGASASTSDAATGASSTTAQTTSPEAETTVANAGSSGVEIMPAKIPPEERMKMSLQNVDPNPVVGVGRGTDYAEVTRTAVKNAGGLEGIIKEGDTVLIKPNMIKAAAPEAGIITDYRMVQELADIAKELGASRIIVADGSPWGEPFKDEITCYNKLTGVELVDFNYFTKDECYELMHEKSLTKHKLFIPKLYMNADVVISAAKLKTHTEAFVTLSLKNAFGVPPAPLSGGFTGKMLLHQLGLRDSVVDLNLIRKPDFSIIDGIIGGEGNMPLAGTPVDSQIIFASKDPVAADSVATSFMGVNPNYVLYISKAAEIGLGVDNLDKIKLAGLDDLDSVKMKFKLGSY